MFGIASQINCFLWNLPFLLPGQFPIFYQSHIHHNLFLSFWCVYCSGSEWDHYESGSIPATTLPCLKHVAILWRLFFWCIITSFQEEISFDNTGAIFQWNLKAGTSCSLRTHALVITLLDIKVDWYLAEKHQWISHYVTPSLGIKFSQCVVERYMWISSNCCNYVLILFFWFGHRESAPCSQSGTGTGI